MILSCAKTGKREIKKRKKKREKQYFTSLPIGWYNQFPVLLVLTKDMLTQIEIQSLNTKGAEGYRPRPAQQEADSNQCN